MMLTKFTHSCVRLEKDGKVLVFDPGNFSETDLALAGADAVLITHEHPDHIDVDAVTAALLAGDCAAALRPGRGRGATAGEGARRRAPDPYGGPRRGLRGGRVLHPELLAGSTR